MISVLLNGKCKGRFPPGVGATVHMLQAVMLNLPVTMYNVFVLEISFLAVFMVNKPYVMFTLTQICVKM